MKVIWRLSQAIFLIAPLVLAGCSGEQHSDLRAFVKESENLPRGRIPPLPEVKPYQPIEYAAFDLTDPFKPRKIELPKKWVRQKVQFHVSKRRANMPLLLIRSSATQARSVAICRYVLCVKRFRDMLGHADRRIFRYLVGIRYSVIRLARRQKRAAPVRFAN